MWLSGIHREHDLGIKSERPAKNKKKSEKKRKGTEQLNPKKMNASERERRRGAPKLARIHNNIDYSLFLDRYEGTLDCAQL